MAFRDDIQSASDKLNEFMGKNGPNWRDKLLPAMFRSVPFELLDSKLSGGHRLAKHEYPNRDQGWIESMGEKLPEFSITGFVIGADYFVKRDALIDALRQSGAGTLTDPYKGEVLVVCESWDCAEVRADGRMAMFTMTFTMAGTLETTVGRPSGLVSEEINYGAAILARSTAMIRNAAETTAATLNLIGQAARVVTDAVNQVRSTVDMAETMVTNATVGAVQAYNDLLGIFIPGDSSAFTADNMQLVADYVGFIGSFDVLITAAGAYDDIPIDAVVTSTSASEIAIEKNQAILNRYFRRVYLGCSAIAAVDTAFDSYDTAITARDALTGKLIVAGEQDLAGYTFRFLSDVAGALARLADHATPRFTSSLEVAQLLYGNATRADEITSRNAIEHPGFIIGRTLKVLTE